MRPCPAASIRLSDSAPARSPRSRGLPRLLFLTMAIGLLSTAQASAQEAAQPGAVQDSAGAQTPDKSTKVCRYEDVTGSRMRKRVCHTPEQWEARGRAGQEFVRELDNKPVSNRPVPVGD